MNQRPAATPLHVIGGVLAIASLGLAQAPASRARPPVDFTRDIQPIFKVSCLGCHSGEKPEASLRLDSRDRAFQGGASGKVIVPGDAGQSLLVRKVVGGAPGKRMPPAGSPLPPEKIALLRLWVNQGAKWPEPRTHWAYVKPTRPAPPAVRNKAWVRNPIDGFVLARIEKESLAPSPEASRETLIRRLSLDLTGLPPSPEEVDEFLADARPGAYERLVDRLLASPHYGERWARPWLDLARYADTNGYEKDRRRSIWKYRDWVIQALNAGMPFDQFTVEQIAGDMLPNPTTGQLIATGFHRNTMFNEEGGVDKEEAHWENLVDRVNTTATVWLGSTLACAQCHDHKYDPFSQREYYRMMAFFNNTALGTRNYGDTSAKFIEPELDLPTPDQEKKRKAISDEIAELDRKLKTHTPEFAAAQVEWERSIVDAARDWTVLKPERLESAAGAQITRLADGSLLVSGANPASDTYVIEAKVPAGRITGVRLEALPHDSLPRGGPGRDAYGNFNLTEFHAEAGGAVIRFRKPNADDGRINDTKFKQLWLVDASREDKRLARQIVFTATQPVEVSEGAALKIQMPQHSEFGGQGLGRFRLSITSAAAPARIAEIAPRFRALLDVPPERRTTSQNNQVAEQFRSVVPSLTPARQRLTQLRKDLEALDIVSTLIVREKSSYERPSATIRLRGSFMSKGDSVFSGVPAVLQPLPETEMPNRLGLARWLVSKDNPLTARVTVNRTWEQYFGRGIVETSEDFGSQGQPPSHPELLDWLAATFMDQNWSLKALHKLIVTSATYRQSSIVSPTLLDRDPYNRLFARGPRFRMEAEMIRDVTLAASGLLSRKIGGASVFPYQPDGIWDIPYNDDKWEESEGDDKYRRGMYIFVRRTAPYPAMTTFDAPSREFCTVRRVRTNTPLQALTTLNDPAFYEAARAMAKRIVDEGGDDVRSRASYAFRLAVTRAPSPAEIDRILSWYDRERALADESAAWTLVANVLLNLDEAMTRQ
ncbi:MAG: PSD1 and planctomycete cytochrome C domain-containing protein [Bryobacteraceae bacterium]